MLPVLCYIQSAIVSDASFNSRSAKQLLNVVDSIIKTKYYWNQDKSSNENPIGSK